MPEEAHSTKPTPEHWARIKRLFDQALKKQGTAREVFLKRECGADTALRDEVLHLLDSYEESGEFLEESTSTTSGLGAPIDRTADDSDGRAGSILNARYRLQRRLGTGGIGVVYLAEDLNLLGRPVVVKFLHEYGSTDPARLRKFRQEMEALARIDHPGVVTAFDAGELQDGTPFLVMQYVEGQTLRKVMEAGQIPLLRIASIMRQLGDSLQAAHDKRIIHRDLKPENIMIQQLGNREIVKLIDFGIARVEQSSTAGETALLTVAGTPSYMAPEQLSGRPELASDVFALGVIAFEMVCQRRPFPSKHPYQLRQQHRAGLPRGIVRRLRSDAPSGVEAAIRHAVSFNPADRPVDVKDWCDSLAEALTDRLSRFTRRSMIAVPAAVGVLAFTGAAGWWLNRRSARRHGSVLAQHEGGFDPLSEGFQISGELDGTAIRNPEHTGFDRWRMKTKEQGSYFSPLSMDEKQEALRRGWKITLVGYPEIGGMHAVVDFRGAGQRFDLSLYREPDGRLLVMDCTRHVPTFDGPRRQLTNGPHRCELLYDPVIAACALDVDGVRLITGYKGHEQQQKDHGFFFGVSVWKSDGAQAICQSARFELL